MLIAGGHRLRAAEILGWSEIPAFVLDLDNDQARLAEIDENLVRHELIPLDRANFMAERKALYEKLYPETKHGKTSGNQYTGQKREGDTMSFSQATAEKVGLTERSIQRAVKIATQISPIVKNLLARQATPWTQKDLLILCDVPQELQYTVVEKVTDGMKLNKAIADVSGTATPDDSQEDKQFKKLMQAWGDASPPVQEQFLATLREAKVIES
jgi:ParB family chromosome partitioning protein